MQQADHQACPCAFIRDSGHMYIREKGERVNADNLYIIGSPTADLFYLAIGYYKQAGVEQMAPTVEQIVAGIN